MTGCRRCRSPIAPRCRTCARSTARPPRTSRSTTRRCGTSRSPAGASVSTWSSATRRSRGCSAATATPSRRSARSSTSTCRRSCPRWPGRSVHRTAWRCPDVWDSFVGAFRDHVEPDPKAIEVGRFVAEGGTPRNEELPGDERRHRTSRPARSVVGHGSVVIAAITSCTNTSNPSVMLAAGPARAQGGRGGARRQAVGEDLAGARLARGDRLPRPGGPHPVPRQAGVRPRRLRMHDLHRQLRPVDRRGRDGGRRGRPQRRGRALGQPELRGPCASAGARLLPGVAAAVRGVRARRAHRRRPHDRTARGRAPTGRCSCATSGRPPTRCARRWRAAITEEQFTSQYGRIWDGDEHWQDLPTPAGPVYEWDPASTYVQEPPFFDDLGDGRGRRRHRGRARAGEGRRLDHDRPHLAGRLDQGGLAGGRVPARARRRARGLQLLRFAPGQPRGDDARHVREHPPAQRDGARHRGLVHDAPADRRGHERLRGGRPRYRADGYRRSPCWRARSTAAARAATGRRRVRTCWACGSCWPRATSASTGRTWSAWACCRCSTREGESAAIARAGRHGDASRSAASRPGITPGQAGHGRGLGRGRDVDVVQVTVRIDAAAELEYFTRGGILRMVLGDMLGS